MTRPALVVLADEGHGRAQSLRRAMAAAGRPEPRFVGYDRLLSDPDSFAGLLGPGMMVRFDSPGDSPAALDALLAAGAGACREAGWPIAGAARRPGQLLGPAQLWCGLRAAWRIAEAAGQAAGATLLASAEDMSLAFDKTATSRRLAAAGVPVAERLEGVSDVDGLLAAMTARRMARVFVKLRFGSGAAGMVALARNGERLAAYATARLEDGMPFSLRRAVRMEDGGEIRDLLAALLPLGAHVERWVPKASGAAGGCDLRVLMVAGEPAHIVLRSSPTPMTNLHLGAIREPPESLRARLAPGAWAAAMDSCRTVAGLFPGAFMLGIDLAFLSDLRRHVVLEVNAFGDHLKDVELQGRDPYAWQVERWDGWRPAA